MGAIKSYLDKFGSRFSVASVIPALAFVIAFVVVFVPGSIEILKILEESDQKFDKIAVGIIILVLTVIIGFTLVTLNTYILKFFEGYVFFSSF